MNFKLAYSFISRVQRKTVFTFSVLSVVLVLSSALFFNIKTCAGQSSTLFNDGFESGNFDNWTSTSGNPTVLAGTAIFTVFGGNSASCYAEKDVLPISSDQVFSVSGIVSFNTIPNNGLGNSAIFFNQIFDSDAPQNAVYSFVDGSGNFGLWIGQYPNYITVYDATPVAPDDHYNVTIQLDNPAQLVRLIVNGTTTITHAYMAYSQFQNSNTVNIVEGIISNYDLTTVTATLSNLFITSTSGPNPTPSPTPTPTPNPTGTTYLTLDLEMSATVAEVTYEEANLTMPIYSSWIARDGTLYAGLNETLYKSLDQGITWQPLITFNTTTTVEINGVYVNSLNYIFVSPGTSAISSNLGLWRSVDEGQTWSRVMAAPAGCTVGSFDEDSNGNLFAGIYTTLDNLIGNATILKSTDNGANWFAVYYDSSARHIHDVAVDQSNNYVYASVGDQRVSPWNIGYVLRSTDDGNTWTKILITPQTDTPSNPQMLAINIIDGSYPNGTLYPVARLFGTDYDNGQIFRTTDDVNFNPVLDTGVQSFSYWIMTNDLNGWIYASFVGGEQPSTWTAGIWVSTDNGVSWSVYKTFPVHNAYYGSTSASNFVQGTMYYDVQLDSGWQNGTRLYSSYVDSSSLTEKALPFNISPQIFYNEDNAKLGNDGLTASSTNQSQLSLNAAPWLLLSLGAVEASTVLSTVIFLKPKNVFLKSLKSLILRLPVFQGSKINMCSYEGR